MIEILPESFKPFSLNISPEEIEDFKNYCPTEEQAAVYWTLTLTKEDLERIKASCNIQLNEGEYT